MSMTFIFRYSTLWSKGWVWTSVLSFNLPIYYLKLFFLFFVLGGLTIWPSLSFNQFLLIYIVLSLFIVSLIYQTYFKLCIYELYVIVVQGHGKWTLHWWYIIAIIT